MRVIEEQLTSKQKSTVDAAVARELKNDIVNSVANTILKAIFLNIINTSAIPG